MRVRIVRLLMALCLIGSPWLTTRSIEPMGLIELSEAASVRPLDLGRPIALHPPLRLLSSGTPQTITVEVAPNTLIANSAATATITATVVDLTGTPVSGVNLSGIISPTGYGPISGLGLTDGLGQSIGTWTAGTQIGLSTLEVGDGVVSGTTGIELIAGAVTTVTVAPSFITVTVATTTTFNASGTDAFGNAVPITPTWSTDGGTISQGGVFTAQNTIAASKLITATQGAISQTALVNIIAGPLNSIVITPSTASIVASSVFTFTAAGFDVYSNSVPITPTWSTDGGTINQSGVFTAQNTIAAGKLVTATHDAIAQTAIVNIIAGPLNSIVITPSTASIVASSVLTFTAAGFDVYSNSVPITPTWSTDGGTINQSGVFTAPFMVTSGVVITANDGAISGTASVVITPDVPFTVTLQASPASLTVGASSALTATVVDQYNNTVTNGTSVTFATDRGSVLTPRSTINGLATSTISSTLAGTAHITATSGGHSGFASVVFDPDVPFTVTLQANPASLTVGASSALTATVVDQYNNSVVDGTSVTFATDRGSVLTPRSTTNGFATSTISSTLAGTAHITATSGGRSGFASVVFNPDVPFTVTLQASPASLTVGASSALTATVVDQYNNTVLDGTSVTFATDRGSVLTPRSTINGLAASTISSTLAGTAHITATSGGHSGFASVVFNPGAPFTVTLLANPASLIVGSSSALTATVVDQYNNTVTNGTPVTFATDRGSVLTPRSTTNGLATSTISSTLAGTAHITATSGGRPGSASVVFNPDVPFTVTLQASPASLTVGTSSALTATVVDRYNNTVTNGTSVTFATDRGSVLTPRSTTNGLATSTISSTLAGTAHITATSEGRSGFASVVFNPGAPSTLTLQPPTAVISAGVKITYTAIATDSFGNLIGNVTGGTTFSIAPGSGGVFAANAVTPTVKNTWIITGVIGAASSTATLTVTAAAFNRLAIENAPAGSGSAVNNVTLTVYDTLSVYAAAYDVYNNLIGARTVTWGGTGVVAGRLSPTTGQSTTFTPVISGTGIITAASSGITDTTGLITVQAPALQISKSADPDPITPGAQLHYTIVYTNGGNAAAQNVIITETYPLSITNPLAFPPPSSGNNIWSIGSLGVGVTGTIDVYVTVAGQMPVGSVLTNTVRMGAAKVASAVYTRTTQVNAQPDFKVDIIDSSDPVRPGETFFYTIQYRNDGTAPVTSLRITETYPSQVTFLSANPPPSSGNNVWLTNTLSGGASRLILVTVRVNRPIADEIIMNNQVTIDSNETTPFATTEQTVVNAPEVQLTMVADPLTPTAHSELTYTLRYTNSGSSYAANTIITDALPANTSFERCAPIGCTVNNGLVTWNIGDVPQQSSDLATLTVRIANNLPAGTRITNTARLTSTDLVSATAMVTSTITSAPDVVVTNSNGVTALNADEVTTYVLGYTNLGTAPAQNVVITDRIPDYTTFVGCTACIPLGGGVYSFTLGTVNAAQSSAVTVSVRVASTLPAGLRFITNTARIATATDGDDSVNNTAVDVDAIATHPTLGLSVAYDSSTPYPGKVITYTLRYTNTSAMDTTGVILSVTPSSFITVTPPGWNHVNGVDLWPVGNLNAGQWGTTSYTMTLPLTYTTAMTAFDALFQVQDEGPGGLPPARATASSSIGVPDLVIDQVIVPPAVLVNQPFTATIVVRNAGLGRACNPSNCGGFWIDAFIDPLVPPLSYPYERDGNYFIAMTALDAGQVITFNMSNIMYAISQDPVVYFKVDNYNCSPANGADPCLPSHSSGGLVPESNEYNNVSNPIVLSSHKVYIPLVRRN